MEGGRDRPRPVARPAAPQGCGAAAGPAVPAAGPDSRQSPPAATPTREGKPEDTETLRQTSEDLLVPGLGLGRRPSTSVPWEKEGRGAEEPAEGAGLLREVVSLCRMSSPFRQDSPFSEENTSGNQT